MTIEERLKKVVLECLGVGEDQIKDDARFHEDLGTDSLDDTELVMAVEEEFEIEIPDEDADKILTFGAAVRYITDKS